jgi:hypothetical protein
MIGPKTRDFKPPQPSCSAFVPSVVSLPQANAPLVEGGSSTIQCRFMLKNAQFFILPSILYANPQHQLQPGIDYASILLGPEYPPL